MVVTVHGLIVGIRCPDYARAASLLNCLDCLREGNQFVVGVSRQLAQWVMSRWW